ncbi:MAG: hypothetical protein DIZ80_13085 [endosymbiont of Galathealinum brachiosum]|uniref:Thioredoxin-like fold domain-containing protein n=1 Tax=endosymbiont of Galathealinum brachiosum TaxID=2200906 RepID=A0A370D8Z3_9GAMM|nr:MAG: hypothetical protein DIZ80_13085 [endosymbiont of Galathealinum brachiosum]
MFSGLTQIKPFAYVLLLLCSFSVVADTKIQTVKDLREFKRQIEESGLPVLLLFTTEDCEYCEAIRKNYLLPMIDSGDYASRILFRQIYMEYFSYIRDEQGKLISGDSIALKYNVDVTPTILFVNSDWQELSDRIVGINSLDYFDKLLSTSISRAQSKMLKENN